MPEIIIHTCPEVVFLAVPRAGITRSKAVELLSRKARELGAIPKDFLDAGLLGDPEPTLYALRAKRNELTESPTIKEWAA